MSFFEKLAKRARDVDSLLCVGLDPHKSELSEDSAEGAFQFCQRLVEELSETALLKASPKKGTDRIS